MNHDNDPARFEQVPDFADLFIERSPAGNQQLPPWFDDLDATDVESRDVPPTVPLHKAAPQSAPAPASRPSNLPAVIQKRPLGDVEFQATPPPKSSRAIHIARALTGAREVCLISEREHGEHVRYVLEVKQVYESKHQRIPLVQQADATKGKGEAETQLSLDMPLGLAEAKTVFDKAVAHEFPPAKLKNSDRLVPTHVALL